MDCYVFVTSITKTEHKGIVIEASNGSPEGPPFIRLSLPAQKISKCFIGKRYRINIEESND